MTWCRKGEGRLGQIGSAWHLRYGWTAGPDSRHEIGVTWSSVSNASHVAGQTHDDWLFWWEAHYAF